jgi:hypothetical protein
MKIDLGKDFCLGKLIEKNVDADMQEPGVVEPNVEELYVQGTFHFWRCLAGSNEELK